VTLTVERTRRDPTGTVTFRAGDTILTEGVTLNGSGVASFILSALPDGPCPINAEYRGDAIHAPASPLDQSVAPVIRDTSLLSQGM
jgi:hypothetical protein